MKPKKMTIREKLDMMKEIKKRNEQHRKEFATMTEEQKAHEEELLDMYLEGQITKEELYKRIKGG